MEWVRGSRALRTLRVAGFGGDALPVEQATGMEELSLVRCPDLTSLSWMPSSDQLTAVSVVGASRLTDIGHLGACANVEVLDLSFCSGLTDLEPLRGLRRLKSVDLTGCRLNLDLSPIEHVDHIDFPYPY
jgi:internalin A